MAAMVPSTVDTVDADQPEDHAVARGLQELRGVPQGRVPLERQPFERKDHQDRVIEGKDYQEHDGEVQEEHQSQKYRNPECPITARRI